jgi:hypothetical protein
LATTLLFAAPNMFQDGPYAFTTIEITSDDLARDIRTFDEVATSVGFVIKMRNDRLGPERDTTKRAYQNPARCCFRLQLERRTEAPVLSIFVLDLGHVSSRFRPEECALYARFRQALVARIGAARIVREDGLPC